MRWKDLYGIALLLLQYAFHFYSLFYPFGSVCYRFLLFGIVSSALQANSLGVFDYVSETAMMRGEAMAMVKRRGSKVETVRNRCNVEQKRKKHYKQHKNRRNSKNKRKIGEKAKYKRKIGEKQQREKERKIIVINTALHLCALKCTHSVSALCCYLLLNQQTEREQNKKYS